MIAAARVAPLLRTFGAVGPLTVPTLEIVDHGDNSGATATISSAAVGSTNVICLQSFDGGFGSLAWQAAGTTTGNGSLVLALPAGHYFAYVASTLGDKGAVSSVSYFAVIDGLESLHTRCLSAVQARIRGTVERLDGTHVVIRKLPIDRNLTGPGGVGLPAIVISPQRVAMPAIAGTNSSDDVHYDVLVSIFDRDNQEPTLRLNLERHLLWRQQISRAFRNQRLGGVPEIINAEVEPAEGLLSEAWKNELLASALLLRFTSRETRGI